MTEGAEKNEPSASNASSDSRTHDTSAPKVAVPDEDGPGQVGVGVPTLGSGPWLNVDGHTAGAFPSCARCA